MERLKGAALLALATGLACGAIVGGVALATRIGTGGSASSAWSETVFTAIVYAPLVVIGWLGARLGGGVAFGKTPGLGLALGVAIGVGGMLATVGDAGLAGVLVAGAPARAAPVMLGWGALVILFQAASEEVFFRGWLQPALCRRWGAVPAVAGAAAAFAIAHLAGGERAALSLVNLALGGVAFGLLALRGGGIAAAIGAHAGWNVGEQLLFGLDPNPGIGSFGAVVDRDLVGAAYWGGSAEGLNASLIMTVVLVAVIVPLAWGYAAAGHRPVVQPAA